MEVAALRRVCRQGQCWPLLRSPGAAYLPGSPALGALCPRPLPAAAARGRGRRGRGGGAPLRCAAPRRLRRGRGRGCAPSAAAASPAEAAGGWHQSKPFASAVQGRRLQSKWGSGVIGNRKQAARDRPLACASGLPQSTQQGGALTHTTSDRPQTRFPRVWQSTLLGPTPENLHMAALASTKVNLDRVRGALWGECKALCSHAWIRHETPGSDRQKELGQASCGRLGAAAAARRRPPPPAAQPLLQALLAVFFCRRVHRGCPQHARALVWLWAGHAVGPCCLQRSIRLRLCGMEAVRA